MGKPAFIVPLVVASGLFLENLDGTVLATSLPAMALDLGQDPIQLKLVFTSYLLSLAIFIPISGWCADRFGARNVFRVAMAVFTLGSLGCAFSSSLMEFVVARIIQGLGGAMMTPVGRLIVLRAVPRSELVQAMAWLTIPALIGPVMGPIVGGFITTHFHWRWIFWINLPIGILGIVLASLYIKPSVLQKQQPLDLIGLALSGLGMASVVTGVTIAGQEVLPIYGVVGLILAGLGLLYGYWWHARRLSHAILDMSLFQISSFRSAALGGLVFRIGMGATPFLLPLMLQVGFGMDALQSGLLTFSLAVGAFAMKFSARSILRQFGFRNVLIFNAILGALSLGAMGFIGADTPYGWIYGLLLASGFLRSLQFTSLNTLVYADVPPEKLSSATSLSAVMQQLSTSFGVAVGALILESLRSARGELTLLHSDFTIAFVLVAIISVAALLLHLPLSPAAGNEVSGHKG